MTSRVKVAVVGCGSLTQRGILPHLTQDDAQAAIEVVAACDIDAARAAAVAAQFNVPESYGDYATMLTEADLDAVLLITPIPFHYSQAVAALKAGKHLYVQKTMTITTVEADEVIGLAHDAGVKLVASPGQMLTPAWQRMRELVGEGSLGRVHWALTNDSWIGHEHESFRAASDVDPSWYYKRGGGPMYDMAVYSLHALTGVLGPARRVTGRSGIAVPTRQWRDKTIDVEMDDNTLLLLEFDDALFGVVSGHYCYDGSLLSSGVFGLFGSKGAAEIAPAGEELPYPSRISLRTPDGSQEISGLPPAKHLNEVHVALPESHVWADIRHLIDCIVDDVEPTASSEHARHVIEIIEKGYLSARTGRTEALTTTF